MINESYIHENKIDLKEEIRKIFKYLRDSGEFPYDAPKVVFRKSDAQNPQANAQNINLPTAHYDPNNDTIVMLIHDGRFLRDEIISFLHELRHCQQNREGRLENIQTDNVTEDDNLDKLEREAYEYSGIWFRKYKDSQKKSSSIKEIIDLSQYMRQVAEILTEDVTKYKIYCDLDNVLAGFKEGFKQMMGMSMNDYSQKYSRNQSYKEVDKMGMEFWDNLPWHEGGEELWNYIKKYNPIVLTASPKSEIAREGKKKWISKNISPTQEVIFSPSMEKKHYSGENNILIDDKLETIYSWIEKGGIGIHYTNTTQVINKLKQLGL